MKWQLVVEFPTIKELYMPLFFMCFLSMVIIVTSLWTVHSTPENVKVKGKWVTLTLITVFSAIGVFGMAIWALDWVIRYG